MHDMVESSSRSKPRGDIFRPRGGTPDERVPFEEAFPEIASIEAEVIETGEGNVGLGIRRFNRLSVREFLNCSSHLCGGIGFTLGTVLRDMANLRQSKAHIERPCESREDSGQPCPNRFTVDLQITYRPDPRDSDNRFGVLAFFAWDHDWNNHHFPLSEVRHAAELLREAGIEWVRMDFLWSDLEPRPGQFDFTRYDAIVDAVIASGRKILGVLHYNPSWREGPFNQPPITADFGAYAKAVVARYKDRIGFWEVWNEPDHPNYWTPQDELTAYSLLLREAYAIIKRTDATARVLLGGIAMEPEKKLAWVYAKAGRDSFDIANIHPFRLPSDIAGVKASCEAVRKQMRLAGDGDKPLWVTEIGCPGLGAQDTSKGWWLGGRASEEDQADWAEKVFSQGLQWPGVDKIFWAFLRDSNDHFHDDVDSLGLLRKDLTPKPAFETVKRLVKRF